MENRPGTLREDLATQREFVRERAPVYARLLEFLEAELPHGLHARLERVWRDRRFGAFYERPLLLLAAIRDDALREGEAHPLWRAMAAPAPEATAIDPAAVARAVAPEREHLWRALEARHLQTNEPSRAVTWRWPASMASEVAPDRALALYDVGASAGLNLVADRLPPIWEHEDGSPLDLTPPDRVAERIGFDARPLDVLDEDDARWLRACVWPEQEDREARLERAIRAFRRMRTRPDAPVVVRARAGEVPDRLPHGEDDRLAVVYQTIVRDYLTSGEWEEYRSGLERWLGSRPRGAAIWAELEVTKEARHGGLPAAITVHALGAAGVQTFVLARCEPHPRRLAIDGAAVAAFREALGG